jgi:hypothetical protein
MFRIHSRVLYQFSTVLTMLSIVKKALIFEHGYRNISFFFIRCFLLILNLLGMNLALVNKTPIGAILHLISIIVVLKVNRTTRLNLIKIILVSCLALGFTLIS